MIAVLRPGPGRNALVGLVVAVSLYAAVRHILAGRLDVRLGFPGQARTTVFHLAQMEKLMAQAMRHDGFSVLEIVSNCHTYYGRLNKKGTHLDMLKQMRERAVVHAPDLDLAKSKAAGKDIVTGVFLDDTSRPEYVAQYEEKVQRPSMGGKSHGRP